MAKSKRKKTKIIITKIIKEVGALLLQAVAYLGY